MAQKAQIFQTLLAGLRFDGADLAGGKVYFYSPGTTTFKSIYIDRDKTTEAANPYTLNTNGQARIYGDGVYDIKVTTATGVEKAYWYNVSMVDPVAYGVDATAYSSLAAAVAAIGATNVELNISDTQAVTANLTIPSNIALIIRRTGKISVSTGVTLTINSPFQYGRIQCFEGAGNVAFGSDATSEVYPEWWGIDGTSDDVEIQKALNSTSNNAKVLLAGKTYNMAGGITVRAGKHRLHGSKSTLDYSSVVGAFNAVTVDGDLSAITPYGKSIDVLNGLELIGNTVGTGILYSGTSVNISPSHISTLNLSISLFSTGLQFGTNAYLISHHNIEVYRCTTCIYEPSGLSNYGENISFYNSSFYNSNTVLNHANSNGDMYFFGCSFDYCGVSGATMFTVSGGRITMNGCHLEFANSGTPVTAQVFVVSGDQSRVGWYSGEILGNTSYMTCDYVFNIGAGSSMTVNGARLLSITATTALRTGTGRFILTDIEYGNTPNVIAIKGSSDNLLKDPSFESGVSIQDLFYIASDTATITNRFTGTNVALTVSNITASAGTYSLRVAKVGGVSTTATIGIAVPVSIGDRAYIRFKCINNNSRAATNLAVSSAWGICTGSNGDGVPLFAYGSSYSSFNITPTNAWTQFSGSNFVNGNDNSAAPSWATHAVFLINLFNFQGGTGAPEGGNYSLYFDELEIYKN